MSQRGGARGQRGRQARRGAKQGNSPSPVTRGFQTDADIAASAPQVERKLEKWQDKDGVDVGTLDDVAGGKWDQFEVNNRKFGVKDTYDEHIYTTAIDKSHPDYAARARKAEQLAREIEGQATTNVHLAEERGQKAQNEVDEESKYSGVDRSTVKEQEVANRANDEQQFAEKHKQSEQKSDVKAKKFNFAASAAKATAFRPAQTAVAPQYFVPAPYFDPQYGQQVMMPYPGYYPPYQ